MPVAFDPYFRAGSGTHITFLLWGPPTRILVEWQLADTNEDLSALLFDVERSEDVEFAEFDVLKKDQPYTDPHEFVDTTAPFEDINRKLYYRVRAHRVAPAEDVRSAVTSWFGNPDIIGQEIIYRHQVIAIEGYQGVPFIYWKQRTFGPRCKCWNIVSKRTDANCNTCLSTGFMNPYHTPTPTWLSKEVNQEMLSAAGLQQLPAGFRRVWYTRYPMFTGGDVLLEVQTGKRFRVASKDIAAEKRGVPIQQVLTLEELNPSMIQHKINVDPALVRQLVDDLIAERELREF